MRQQTSDSRHAAKKTTNVWTRKEAVVVIGFPLDRRPALGETAYFLREKRLFLEASSPDSARSGDCSHHGTSWRMRGIEAQRKPQWLCYRRAVQCTRAS